MIKYKIKNKKNIIKNYHAILEALNSKHLIYKLFILKKQYNNNIINEILYKANKQNIIVDFVSKIKLNKILNTKEHKNIAAIISSYNYYKLSDILNNAKKNNEDPFIIILNKIEDSYNFGSIIRTANLVNCHGIIVPKNNTIKITNSVIDTSVGAINYVKIVKVTNIIQTIKILKKIGLWIICADMSGTNMYKLNLKGPIVLIIGGENKGISKNIKNNCDLVASIPMKGNINSLNTSVATSVLLYEIIRQRYF